MSIFTRAVAGLVIATPLWAFVFRSKRGNFWTRMGFGAGFLGLYALWARPALRQEVPRLKDVLSGTASAAGLYILFQIGDRLARRILPRGTEEIAAIYRLRTAAPRPLIAALLVTVVAPSEELFWRGLVQQAFEERFGRGRGDALAIGTYGVIHLVSGNLTLAAAAGTAGAYWGAEYLLSPRLGPTLVSHILWDIWIFLIQPTPGGLTTEDGKRT